MNAPASVLPPTAHSTAGCPSSGMFPEGMRRGRRRMSPEHLAGSRRYLQESRPPAVRRGSLAMPALRGHDATDEPVECGS
jgi:hypothetical protein